MFQELAKVSAIVAAGLVGIVSIGNAIGRVFWAWVSDTLTRRVAFVLMFAVQVVLFWINAAAAYGAATGDCQLRNTYVVWGRLRDHASVRGRLFWSEERGSNLWPDADGLGICECFWTASDCQDARDHPPIWRGLCTSSLLCWR